MTRLAVIAALALAACATTPEQVARQQESADQQFAEAIGNRVPGEPVECIDSTYSNGPQVIDSNRVLYRQGGRVYRNDIPDGCPFLHGDEVMIVETTGTELCHNDRFRVLPRGSSIPTGYCRLGPFTPYSTPGS